MEVGIISLLLWIFILAQYRLSESLLTVRLIAKS